VDLTRDHKTISDAHKTRRYFSKFERIIGHLQKVSVLAEKENLVTRSEADIVLGYLMMLKNTFTALSYKHLMGDRVSNLPHTHLNIDKSDSGFPIFSEILRMATDALQSEKHLKNLPSASALKQEMVTHILNELETPTRLQFAMSQRLYYNELSKEMLFWAQNDPQAVWLGKDSDDRDNYLLHWAIYDSQTNLPVIYLMDVKDVGRTALPRDERRWPSVQAHLTAQSISSLGLLTIAKGFDTDFDDIYPMRLRRFTFGPMYSHAFTEQHGPLRDILAQAAGEPGLDWTLTWTVETLNSKSSIEEKTGFFSKTERQVYDVDTTRLGLQGVTDSYQSIILPHRAYQVMEEMNHAMLRRARKYVVGDGDQILSYR
jgi:hypothetical protein